MKELNRLEGRTGNPSREFTPLAGKEEGRLETLFKVGEYQNMSIEDVEKLNKKPRGIYEMVLRNDNGLGRADPNHGLYVTGYRGKLKMFNADHVHISGQTEGDRRLLIGGCFIYTNELFPGATSPLHRLDLLNDYLVSVKGMKKKAGETSGTDSGADGDRE
jgi:hypothetical protein